ncbi:MAG: hypothetical protein C4337_06630 [Armatimonadota bacterium]
MFARLWGWTHLSSPTQGGTYLNTLFSWHKISLTIVRVRGAAGLPIESFGNVPDWTYEYMVADGTGLRFRVQGEQFVPAFGVQAQLRQLGDTYMVQGGPPGAIAQGGRGSTFSRGIPPMLGARDAKRACWRFGIR